MVLNDRIKKALITLMCHVQSLLYICVCVCARVRAHVCVCMRVCVWKESDGHLEQFLPSLAALLAKSLGVRVGGNWPSWTEEN